MTSKGWCVVLAILACIQAWAIEEQPSVLSRVMTVDDPGLAECIRVAVEGIPTKDVPVRIDGYESRRLEIIRGVTDSYSQIRLFDSQIAQIDKRLLTAPLPEGLSYELTIARAELDMKRATELGKLRLQMGVLPRYAFGQWPADKLGSWVVLDFVDANHICVFRYGKPFYDYFTGREMSSECVGSKPYSAAQAYVSELMGRKDSLPLRINVLRTAEGDRQAVRMAEELELLAKRTGTSLDLDLRLSHEIRAPRQTRLYVVGGQIGQSLGGRGNSPAGQLYGLGGLIDPNGLDRMIKAQFLREPSPGYLPMTWVVEYHAASQELASTIAQRIRSSAQDAGVAQFVGISMEETRRLWGEQEAR